MEPKSLPAKSVCGQSRCKEALSSCYHKHMHQECRSKIQQVELSCKWHLGRVTHVQLLTISRSLVSLFWQSLDRCGCT